MRALVGQAPEKLGLDELFLDVTRMVDDHLASLAAIAGPSTSRARFVIGTRSFSYDPSEAVGVVLPRADTPVDPRLVAASYLVHWLRESIHTELGFTTSGGLGPNKMVAKLCGSLHKPAQQTIWASSTPVELHDFLAPHQIRRCATDESDRADAASLQGFGSRICETLKSNLVLPEATSNGAVKPDHQSLAGAKNDLTVAHVRQSFDAPDFNRLFDAKNGPRSVRALAGRD